MQAQDKREFVKLMAVLGETFDKEISDSLASIYFRAFETWSLPMFQAAVEKAVIHCRFFPKPAELVELMEGSDADQAEGAWRAFWTALEHAGTYRSLYCEDTLLAETIRQVFHSWPEAGHIPRPDSDQGPMYQARHKEFLATYRMLQKRGGNYEPHLVGRLEADALEHMHHWERGGLPQEPKVIYLTTHGEIQDRPLRLLEPEHPILAFIDRMATPAITESDLKALTDGGEAS